MEMIRF